MITLYKSEELVNRLSRIENPIAKYILELQEVDETDKGYINYLGISSDNPSYISFLDKNKIERNKIERIHIKKWYGDNCKVKLKKTAFKKYFNRGNWIDITMEDDAQGTLPLYDRDSRAPQRYSKKASEKVYNAEIFGDNIPYNEILSLKDLVSEASFWTPALMIYPPNGDKPFFVYTCGINNLEIVSVNEEKTLSNDLWNADKRIKASASKIQRAIGDTFNELFTHKDLDEFITLFRYEACRECGTFGEFLYEEVQGDDIKKFYNEDTYLQPSNGGQLWNSCMRYSGCRQYFDLYTLNKNYVSMAVLTHNGMVAARSILWFPNGKNNEGRKFSDRIYAYDENSHNILKATLSINGFINIYGSDFSEDITIDLDYGTGDIKYFPYVDTVKFISGKQLTNWDSDSDFELTETNGGPTSGRSTCDNCGECEDDDNLYYISRGSGRDTTLCGDCSSFCEDIDEYVAEDDAVYDNVQGAYYYRNNCVELHNEQWCHIDNSILLHNGDYCRDTEEYETDENGDAYLFSDINDYCLEHEGQWYTYDSEQVVLINEEYYHINSKEYKEILAKESF